MQKTNVERAAYAREWRKKNPDKARQASRNYYARNREAMQSRDRQRRPYRLEAHLLRRYGISQEQYDEILAKQGGKCGVCEANFGDRRPHVDHDHATGNVRGILCAGCNHGLGYVEKDGFIERARAYLARRAVRH